MSNKIRLPKANKIEKKLIRHGDLRIDNYYWLNDRENPEVIDFIKMKKCKQYLVSHKLKDAWTEYPKDGSILFLQDLMMVPQSTFKYVRNWCSGSSCLITAFDISVDIHILGMDCNYVEMIPECEELEDGTLKITKTPAPGSNPNYFFDDYQRVGDIYNKPNGQKKTSNA